METMRIEIKHENGSRFTAELADSSTTTEMIEMFVSLLLMIRYHPQSINEALEKVLKK